MEQSTMEAPTLITANGTETKKGRPWDDIGKAAYSRKCSLAQKRRFRLARQTKKKSDGRGKWKRKAVVKIETEPVRLDAFLRYLVAILDIGVSVMPNSRVHEMAKELV